MFCSNITSTKREVRVYLGRPEGLEDDDLEHHGEDEGFCIDFIEADGQSSLAVTSNCLCALHDVTEAWLTGASPEEIQAAMSHDHNP